MGEEDISLGVQQVWSVERKPRRPRKFLQGEDIQLGGPFEEELLEDTPVTTQSPYSDPPAPWQQDDELFQAEQQFASATSSTTSPYASGRLSMARTQEELSQPDQQPVLPPAKSAAYTRSSGQRQSLMQELQEAEQQQIRQSASARRSQQRRSSAGQQPLSLQSAQWQVKQENRWQDLGAEACRALQNADVQGVERVQLTSGIVKYEVDIKAMTQTNLKTKKVREIRRKVTGLDG